MEGIVLQINLHKLIIGNIDKATAISHFTHYLYITNHDICLSKF